MWAGGGSPALASGKSLFIEKLCVVLTILKTQQGRKCSTPSKRTGALQAPSGGFAETRLGSQVRCGLPNALEGVLADAGGGVLYELWTGAERIRFATFFIVKCVT